MPCASAKARWLLEAGKAEVSKRTTFTIQLLYGSTGYKQPVILGVDAGSKTIGYQHPQNPRQYFLPK